MICLAIDTSTTLCSVAVVDNISILAEFSVRSPNKHSETVLLLVDRVLKETGLNIENIDIFGVSTGPGSFTGLRVGISVAKGFGFAVNKKIAGVSLFEVLACQAEGHGYPGAVCPMIDAGKGQVYTCLYTHSIKAGLKKEINETVTEPEKWLNMIKNISVLFTGSGAVVYSNEIEKIHSAGHFIVPEIINMPRCSTIAFLALKRYHKIMDNCMEDVSPLYIRPPDAVLGGES